MCEVVFSALTKEIKLTNSSLDIIESKEVGIGRFFNYYITMTIWPFGVIVFNCLPLRDDELITMRYPNPKLLICCRCCCRYLQRNIDTI